MSDCVSSNVKHSFPLLYLVFIKKKSQHERIAANYFTDKYFTNRICIIDFLRVNLKLLSSLTSRQCINKGIIENFQLMLVVMYLG